MTDESRFDLLFDGGQPNTRGALIGRTAGYGRWPEPRVEFRRLPVDVGRTIASVGAWSTECGQGGGRTPDRPTAAGLAREQPILGTGDPELAVSQAPGGWFGRSRLLQCSAVLIGSIQTVSAMHAVQYRLGKKIHALKAILVGQGGCNGAANSARLLRSGAEAGHGERGSKKLLQSSNGAVTGSCVGSKRQLGSPTLRSQRRGGFEQLSAGGPSLTAVVCTNCGRRRGASCPPARRPPCWPRTSRSNNDRGRAGDHADRGDRPVP